MSELGGVDSVFFSTATCAGPLQDAKEEGSAAACDSQGSFLTFPGHYSKLNVAGDVLQLRSGQCPSSPTGWGPLPSA